MSSHDALDPKSTHAFIVGVDLDDEWANDRAALGDIRLVQSFRSTCQLPPHRVVHIRDADATRDRVMRELRELLRRTKTGDTLILYYGGHGENDVFCTADDEVKWSHNDVVGAIEQDFRGERAWILVDCCNSGDFGRRLYNRLNEDSNRLNEDSSLRVSYLCLMSTLPNGTAGEEYSFTKEWLNAVEDGASGGNVTVTDVISRMADEVAREKQQVLTAFACGSGIDFNAPFPFASDEGDRSKAGIPSKSQVLVNPISLSKGNHVHVKWGAGCCISSCSQILPCWYPGTIISTPDDADGKNCVAVELCDPITDTRWGAKVSRANILDDKLESFYQLEMPTNCTDSHVALAEQRAYITYEGMPPGTNIRVLCEEDDGSCKLYQAEVVRPREVSWKYLDQGTYNPGPLIPVHWTEEGTQSLVPPWRCIIDRKGNDYDGNAVSDEELMTSLQEITKRKEIEAATSIGSAREAIMAGFHSAGKVIATAESYNGGEDCIYKCYCAESGKWIKAEVLQMDRVPMRVFAGHLCYRETGLYGLVYWHDDGSLELVPRRFLRKL